MPSSERWILERTIEAIQGRYGFGLTASTLEVHFPLRATLRDVVIYDDRGDTVIAVRCARSSLRGLNPWQMRVSLGDSEVEGAYFRLYTREDGTSGLGEFVDHVRRDPNLPPRRIPVDFRISRLRLRGGRFVMRNARAPALSDSARLARHRVSFRDLDVRIRRAHLEEFRVLGKDVRWRLHSLDFRDHSGLAVDSVHGFMSLRDNQMYYRDLVVRSDSSRFNFSHLIFDYSEWASLRTFQDSVSMLVGLQEAYLANDVLGYFFSFPSGVNRFRVGLNAEGKIDDLRVQRLVVSDEEGLALELGGFIQGLPDLENTLFNVDVSSFHAPVHDVERIVADIRGKPFILPYGFHNLGELRYRGSVLGFLEDLVIYGAFSSELGALSLDVSLSIRKDRPMRYRGRLRSERLNLRRMFLQSELGYLAFHAVVDGDYSEKGGFRTHITSQVHSFDFHGYRYKGIRMEGNMTPQSYVGTLTVNDPAVHFDFDGLVDFQDSVPSFHFDATLHRVSLHTLQLVEDSVAEGSCRMQAFFQGNRLDNFQGYLSLYDITYRNRHGSLAYDSLRVESHNAPDYHYLSLQSSVVEADLYGELLYDDLIPLLSGALLQHVPSFASSLDSTWSIENYQKALQHVGRRVYRGELRVLDADKLLQVLYPKVGVASGSRLKFDYVPIESALLLRAESDSIRMGKLSFINPLCKFSLSDSVLAMLLTVKHGIANGVPWEGLSLESKLYTDTAESKLRMAVPGTLPLVTELNWKNYFYAPDSVYPAWTLFELDESWLDAGEARWMYSQGRVVVDRSGGEVSNFSLGSGDHRLKVQGRISRSEEDTLRVGFSRVDLGLCNVFLGDKLLLGGTLDGGCSFSGLLGDKRGMHLDLNMDYLSVNGVHVGTVKLAGSRAGKNRPFDVSLHNISLEGEKVLALESLFDIKKRYMVGFLEVDHLDISPWSYVLHSYLSSGKKEGVDRMSGLSLSGGVSGMLDIEGVLSSPRVTGWIQLEEAQAHWKSLNLHVGSSSRLEFLGNQMHFHNFELRDASSGRFLLNGDVFYGGEKGVRFNLTSAVESFQFMNTSTMYDLPYYGRAVLSGDMHAWGNARALNLDMNLRSERGTNVWFELPSSRVAESSSQLTFVRSAADSAALLAKERMSMSVPLPEMDRRLNLKMGLKLTDATLMQVVVNPRTGDLLRFRGDGDLHFSNVENDQGLLHVYGDYIMSRGEYQFAFEGLLSKKFRISPESRIRFQGDPLTAGLDLTAVYRTRASLAPLMGNDARDDRYKRRIPVECKIQVGGNVASPRLRFSIAVPRADAESQGALATALNSEEKVMRQFASLLMLNQFSGETMLGNEMGAPAQPTHVAEGAVAGGEAAPHTETGSTGLSDALLSSFWEFFSGQINSWLSHLENAPTVDLGFNYRPNSGMGQYARDEAEVSVSMQWFGGKLNIDANWDVNRNNTTSAVAGDLVVTQQSHYVENLKYKAFVQSNDNLVFHDLNPYTAGAGVIYSDSFDSWREVWDRIAVRFRRKRKSAPSETDDHKNDTEEDENQETEEDILDESLDETPIK